MYFRSDSVNKKRKEKQVFQITSLTPLISLILFFPFISHALQNAPSKR